MLLLGWHCCPHCNGVAIVDAQASLQSRHLCHCCINVVALVAMALLPPSSWCCCPHHNCVIAIVDAQKSLPLSRWRHRPCCTGAIVNIAWVLLPLLHWGHHHYSADLLMHRHHCKPGIFAIIVITLLPLLQGRCCHCQAGVVALVKMASSPSSILRHLCRCHDGIIALVAMAPLPTLHGRCCPCCTSVILVILLTSLSSHCMCVVTIIEPALLPPSSWCVCNVYCGYNYLRLIMYAN